MGIRVTWLSLLALIGLGSLTATEAVAQKAGTKTPARREIQTATTAKTEMIAGSISSAQSLTGDEISLRLNEDVKSNGRTVLKKGTVLVGVIRSARQLRSGSETAVAGKAQSMIEIEWLTPSSLVTGTGQLMIALQSFTYVSPLVQETAASADRSDPTRSVDLSSTRSAASSSFLPKPNGKTNAALMSMPSIVPLDQQASSFFETDFGLSDEQQIYKTGRGDMMNSSGKRQSVNLFSRMTNDTIMTSADASFEIGTGAQMQLLVGVERK